MALKRPHRDTPTEFILPEFTEEDLLPPIRVLTAEESRALFNEEVRERLGISGDEFVARFRAGYYDDILDDFDYSDVMELALLGPWSSTAGQAARDRLSESSKPAPGVALGPMVTRKSPEPLLPPDRTPTREEYQAFFDEQARELLGISGAEFVERWYAGEYDDISNESDRSDILYLTEIGFLDRQE